MNVFIRTLILLSSLLAAMVMSTNIPIFALYNLCYYFCNDSEVWYSSMLTSILEYIVMGTNICILISGSYVGLYLCKRKMYFFSCIELFINIIPVVLATHIYIQGKEINTEHLFSLGFIFVVAHIILRTTAPYYLKSLAKSLKESYPHAVPSYKSQKDILQILDQKEKYYQNKEKEIQERIKKEEAKALIQKYPYAISYRLGININSPFGLSDNKIDVILSNKENLEQYEEDEINRLYIYQILSNERRKKYVGSFNHSKKYCVRHPNELDDFCKKCIDTEYNELCEKYPLGVEEYHDRYNRYWEEERTLTEEEEYNDKESCIKSEKELIMLEKMARKYNDLYKKYPNGIKAIESQFCFGEIQSDIKVHVVNAGAKKLYQLELKYGKVKAQEEWEKAQKEFTQFCRKNLISGWGCYFYKLDFPILTYDGETRQGEYKIWQFFCESFCCDQSLDYSHFGKIEEHYNDTKRLKTLSVHFYNSVYDKILAFAKIIRDKYNDITIVFGDSGIEKCKELNNYHFSYLKEILDKESIKYLEDVESIKNLEITESHIVVVELISNNKHLLEESNNITSNHKGEPCITFVSLEKEYDTIEMKDLIKQENEKIQKEKEETEKREKELREVEERKQKEFSALKLHVSAWDTLDGYLAINYLFPYYPTTCDFEATEEEWDNRWLVWNFKNTPGKTSTEQHERALSELLPRISTVLYNTFGNDIAKLVLVCIPAATSTSNNARYKEFSQRLTRNTGMINSFDYIQITEDATPKHLGGTGNPTIHIDEDFFKDKYVLLFDDIITRGNSMIKFKLRMEKLGAKVIAGFSIGRTRHERDW